MSHMNDFKIKTEMMNIEKSTCFERIDARKLMCVILIYSGGLSSMNVGVERVPGFVRSISIRCDTECLFALLKDASFSLLNVLAPGRLWAPTFQPCGSRLPPQNGAACDFFSPVHLLGAFVQLSWVSGLTWRSLSAKETCWGRGAHDFR